MGMSDIIIPELDDWPWMNRISLEPMTKDDHSEYMIDNIKRYARDGVKSGRWEMEESLEESEKSIKEILPNGMKTKNNFFFNIVDKSSNKKVGVLWLTVQDKTKSKSVFIYDILIFEGHRDEGLGTETLNEIESWGKGIEAGSIWLHAFCHNQKAIALYRRLGYTESDVTMSKKIKQ
jgi:RimJ/RimL family protein N-acetyltransferase